MTDLEQIRAVKKRAEARLHAIPGVHSAAVGKKIVDGKRTEELAIVLFVTEKKPLGEIPAGEVIPREVEGTKTDVVQKPRVRLLRADPTRISTSIAPLPPGGAVGSVLTLSGDQYPGDGLVVVVYITVTDGKGVARKTWTSQGTGRGHSLVEVAGKLRDKLAQQAGMTTAASTSPPATMTVFPDIGFTAEITRAVVIAADDDKYFPEYLRGGIAIERGNDTGTGTLGCLATTAHTAVDPQGKVVALTNFHMVCPPSDRSTNLKAVAAAGGSVTFSITDGHPILSETLVVATITKRGDLEDLLLFSAYYTSAPGDTVDDVATGIVAAMKAASYSGVIKQFKNLDGAVVQVADPNIFMCGTFGTPIPDPKADLFGTVSKPDALSNVVKFDGKVSTGEYGIFVNINPGGKIFSLGSFTNPTKGQSLGDVAKAVIASITNLPDAIRGDVKASLSGTTAVRIEPAEQVECRIVSDIQFGQPDNSFGSPCSRCCSHRIGRVLDAQIHADAALIQLDPDMKYKMEIQDFTGGLVAGPPPTMDQIVEKRGKTSGKTVGKVIYVDLSTEVNPDGGFFRTYNHGFIVEPNSDDPFAMPGDSGSAVISTGVPNTLVGLLYGHEGTNGAAMAISEVFASFPKLALSFSLPAGADINAVQIVPKSAAAFEAISGEQAFAGAPFGARLGPRLDAAENEIRSTARGRELADGVRQHLPEALTLVNENRRVATVWHRSGGPELLEAVLRVIQFRGERLPAEINGRPFAECLAKIQRALGRYASPALRADLGRYAPQIASFSRMSFVEVLTLFESTGVE